MSPAYSQCIVRRQSEVCLYHLSGPVERIFFHRISVMWSRAEREKDARSHNGISGGYVQCSPRDRQYICPSPSISEPYSTEFYSVMLRIRIWCVGRIFLNLFCHQEFCIHVFCYYLIVWSLCTFFQSELRITFFIQRCFHFARLIFTLVEWPRTSFYERSRLNVYFTLFLDVMNYFDDFYFKEVHWCVQKQSEVIPMYTFCEFFYEFDFQKWSIQFFIDPNLSFLHFHQNNFYSEDSILLL